MKKLLTLVGISICFGIFFCASNLKEKDVQKVITNKVKSELKYPDKYKTINYVISDTLYCLNVDEIDNMQLDFMNLETQIIIALSTISTDIKYKFTSQSEINAHIKTAEELIKQYYNLKTKQNTLSNQKQKMLKVSHDFFSGINCKRHCEAILDKELNIIDFYIY